MPRNVDAAGSKNGNPSHPTLASVPRVAWPRRTAVLLTLAIVIVAAVASVVGSPAVGVSLGVVLRAIAHALPRLLVGADRW